VELPRLPGHGTSVEDMVSTGWSDWCDEAEAALRRLQARCERVVVAGLSMGATLALWLAANDATIDALVCVNPLVVPHDEEILAMARDMVAEGDLYVPAGDSDIANPAAWESAYKKTPVPCYVSLQEGLAAFAPQLTAVSCPMLIMTSVQDHVVDPTNSDVVASTVKGPVTRVSLERSYHVATLDYDRDIIETQAVTFALSVLAPPGHPCGQYLFHTPSS
jgi:carboxylesterase